MHPLRVGLKLSNQVFPIDVHRRVWRIADKAGFDGCWGFDHLLALGSDPAAPVYEGWAFLAAMAEATRRPRIGLMVTGNLYRHPGLLAKLGATVDHLSGGRLEMGIGAAWNEPEFRMLHMDFPSVGERIRRLDEACTVIKRLWTEPRATFAGRYYALSDAIAEPKPLQRPHPPIWIGGSGPKRTLRVVAKQADVWNSNAGSFEGTVELAGILDEHCRAVGRDPESVRRSVQLRFGAGVDHAVGEPVGLVDDAVRTAERYVRAGFSEQILLLGGPDPVKNAELAARELLPRLRTIG